MKPSAFKILNYFIYLDLFTFVTHLNQRGSQGQVQVQVQFPRCPDFVVAKGSTSILPEQTFQPINLFYLFFLKEVQIYLQYSTIPFCIWSNTFLRIIGEKNHKPKEKSLMQLCCVAVLTICLVSGYQSNTQCPYRLWAP